MIRVLICCAMLAACSPTARTAPADTLAAAPERTDNGIDYVEFAAADIAAFKAFYAGAFGWTFEDWGPDYASFTGAGVEGGVRAGEPVAGSTLNILYASDLGDAERRVAAAGGEIVERQEFPGGRRFHFRDPAGNVLGVWTRSAD